MANSVIQTIRDAEIDARSLSEFVSKDASFTVTRRLAPTIHTLDYYLLVLNKVKDKGDLADIAISDTLEKLEQLEPTVMQRVEDAIYDTVLSSGFVTIDSFELGATITQRNQALRHAADGKLYRWAGDLPKVVPANSTPTSSGGMGDNAWLEVSDTALRQELTHPDIGAAMMARGVVAVDSIADLLALPEGQRKEGLRYLARGYQPGSDIGIGVYYWDSTKSKAEHNGGTVIDPDKSFPSNWSVAVDVDSWFTPPASGSGCFVLISDNYTALNFGVRPNVAVDQSIQAQAYVDYIQDIGGCVFKFPMANGEQYQIDNTVNITRENVAVEGGKQAGRIGPRKWTNGYGEGFFYGDAINGNGIFNFFTDISRGTGAITFKGVSFYKAATSDYIWQRDFSTMPESIGIHISDSDNRPHRAISFVECSWYGIKKCVNFDSGATVVPGNTAGGQVSFTRCAANNCGFVLSSAQEVRGVLIDNNMFEHGARFDINSQGQTVISNNMLEGQSDPILFRSATVFNAVIRDNYIEGIGGEYFVKISGGADGRASVTMGDNWPESWGGTTAKYGLWLQGRARVIFDTDRHWQKTPGCYLAVSGKLASAEDGSVIKRGIVADYSDYTTKTPILTGVVENYRDHINAKPDAVIVDDLGTDTVLTPFLQQSDTAFITTSSSATISENLPAASISYAAGDVILLCAIVRNSNDIAINMASRYYTTKAGTRPIGFSSLPTRLNSGQWRGYFSLIRADVSGSSFSPNIYLSSTAGLEILRYSVQVITAEDLYSSGTAEQFRCFLSF